MTILFISFLISMIVCIVTKNKKILNYIQITRTYNLLYNKYKKNQKQLKSSKTIKEKNKKIIRRNFKSLSSVKSIKLHNPPKKKDGKRKSNLKPININRSIYQRGSAPSTKQQKLSANLKKSKIEFKSNNEALKSSMKSTKLKDKKNDVLKKINNHSSYKERASSSKTILKNSIILKNLNNSCKNIEKVNSSFKPQLNIYELNSLPYKQALKNDQRTFCQYYIDLLKKKHLIIFLMYSGKDYNLPIIKISLFLVSFSLYLSANAFFYTDSTMNKIYEENGKYNFIYHLPQMIYSSLASSLINVFIRNLALSEKDILSIKNYNYRSLVDLDHHIKNVKNKITIKFLFFYTVSILLMSFFWYFISCFCSVYKNTQMLLISDTVISFFLSMLYPFGYNLIPGLFRIRALKDAKKNRINMYKMSNLLALF